MPAEARYTTTEDGVRIAYTIEGEGPPLLVVPQLFESFSLISELTDYDELLRLIGEGRTLIHFDTRGCGLSQRDVEDLSADALRKDIAAVVRAAGLARFSVFGGKMSGLVALSYAAQNQDSIAALVLFSTIAHTTATGTPEVLMSFAQLARNNWDVAARALAAMSLRRSPDAAAKAAAVSLQSIAGEAAARTMEQNINDDVRDSLGRITARTLVIHSISDALYPFSSAQEIATRIPGARLLPLEGNHSLTSLGDKTRVVTDAINSFLDEDPETRRIAGSTARPVSGLRTVLFTDLVGHTTMMRRLGDEQGRAVLREHERITREVLRSYGGAELKMMGDGFMASFPSVTRAVECALALQTAFVKRNESGAEPLSVRIGLNAGEPIEEEGDLFGETVILAARIAAMAEGGEVLASLAVRELCAGKGFLFADMGKQELRGFEDPVRVFEIKQRD